MPEIPERATVVQFIDRQRIIGIDLLSTIAGPTGKPFQIENNFRFEPISKRTPAAF
jgi:hypothetical protein